MKHLSTIFAITLLAACTTHTPVVLPQAMHDAVVEVVNKYNPVSVREDTEYMGMVVKKGNEYTTTATKGVRGAGNVTILLNVPCDGEVVALWHSHGGEGLGRKYYSAMDSAVVTKYQLPFYMVDHTGTLRVLVPGHNTISLLQAEKIGLGRISGTAKGQFVANVEK